MKYRKWEGDDLENIVNRSIDELVIIYPDVARNTLFTLQRYHQKIGTKVERQEPYIDAKDEKEKADRRRGVSKTAGGAAMKGMVSIFVKEEHKDYHEQLQKHLDEYGTASKARFSDYQMGMKNADGEFEAHDLKAVRFEVNFDTEPKWPPVNRIESVRLPKKESKKGPDESKTAVILPDLQIPFHDEEAVNVALQIVRDAKPDKIVILGDMLDLSAWGKYEQRPEFARATQDSIIEAHKLLATLRKLAPMSEIAVMAGNHEQRMEKSLLANAQAAYGLKRADQPDGWPVMSVPYLCAFDQLDVEYVAGYPASRYWINERLQIKHGNRVRSSGSTAKLVSDDERVSTIFGHIHRIEAHYKTVNVYEGGKTNAAYSIGCLCRIDGSVPSTHNSYDLDGQPVKNYENWQQGLAVIGYQEGYGSFNVQQIYINSFEGYAAHYNNRTYKPQ